MEEAPLEFRLPRPSAPPRIVCVRIDLSDRKLRQQIIAAGGRRVVAEQCLQPTATAARRLGIARTGSEPE